MPNNISIMAALQGSSIDFGTRIPAETQADLISIGTAIARGDFEKESNEFISALVNRIGKVVIIDKLLRNPLSSFKKGIIPFGDAIEEIMVDVVKAHTYKPNAEEDQFEKFLPPTKVMFHRMNRQNYYPITVQRESLAKAFISENGLQRFIDSIVQSIYKSDTLDEFLLMKNLFAQYLNSPTVPLLPDQTVPVPVVSDTASGTAFYQALKTAVYALQFPSRLYNPQGMYMQSNPGDLALFVRSDILANIEVNVLAKAFNMGQVTPGVPIIPLDDFGTGNDDVIAILADRDWFMVYDNVMTLTTAQNARGLYWNYFLHHWQYLSLSYFQNFVVFREA